MEERPRFVVRVRPTTEDTRPGWIVGVLGGLGLLGCVYLPHHHPYLLVGISLAAWGAGPMLAWRPRARIGLPELTNEGSLRVGELVVPHGAGAQIASGKRGVSVAMSWKGGAGAFFEVATLEHARALVRMASADETRNVDLRLRHDVLRAATRVVGFISACCGLGYAVMVGLWSDSDYKGTFGLPGLIFAIIGSFMYLITQLARRSVVVSGPGSEQGAWGAIGRHLTLHVRVHGAGVHAEDVGADANDGVPPRVRVMLREDEPTRAWLDRIDSAANGDEGYRGVAPSREELSAVLADGNARADLRLAAVRVLVRRHGASKDDVAAKLDPQLREYAARVSIDDADRAAEHLDELGPVFRAIK